MAFSRRTEPISPSSLAEPSSHFFKVILPATLEEKKLRIPEMFVRKFGDELSDVATMREPNGRVWHVKLIKDGKKIWFHDEWHDFAKYHSICAGYFLVFKYERNSDFRVLIFDKTACEVQYLDYREELKNDEQNSLQHDEKEIDNAAEITGTYKSVERGASRESKRIKHPNGPDSSTQEEHEEEVKTRCRFYGNTSATKRLATTAERERAIEAAKAFEPANPFCTVVLRPTHVQRHGVMFLPSHFSAKHLKGVSGFIELQLSDGKQWPVRSVYRRQRTRFSQGWREFTLENNLREGDVCVFEVLSSRDVVLKVTIFRVLDNAESVNRQSFVSALGSNRCQKCVASLETQLKHDYKTRNKRCKIEEVEMIDKSDVVGDVSDLREGAYKFVTHSSDEKNGTYDEHEFLALLKDMGICLARTFKNIAAEAKERVINTARLLNPTNPSFIVILQTRSIDKASLYVPSNFASKYLSRDAKIIKLQVPDGREWPVQLRWRQSGTADISIGWIKFFRENNLKKGDVCLFELIRTEDFLLKVYFIQCCVNLSA